MASERELIANPLPRAKLRVLQVTGFLALAVIVVGFGAFVVNEAEITALISSLPFGPEDAGWAVMPFLSLPVFLYLLLVGRWSQRYGSCELVPGALLLRPLTGPEEKPGNLTPVALSSVTRAEDLDPGLRLEFLSGGFAHVPTQTHEEVKRILDLIEGADASQDPLFHLQRGCLTWPDLLRFLWYTLFFLPAAGCTLRGVARFAPGLGRGELAPELLLLVVLLPLMVWIGRTRVPRWIGTEHRALAPNVQLVAGGLILPATFLPYEGLSAARWGRYLALSAGEDKRLVWAGPELDALWEALRERAPESLSSSPPDWLPADPTRGYALSSLVLGSLLAIQAWVFVLADGWTLP